MEREIILPKLAYLDDALALLREGTTLVDRAVPSQHIFWVKDGERYDLSLAAAVHALNAVDAARAAYVLGKERMTNALAPHTRTLFEVVVKIRWMRAEPRRAKMYLESEPFERYANASPLVRAKPVFDVVKRDCADMMKRNPDLLELPRVKKPKFKADPYRAIALDLRMPPLRAMAASLGLDEDDAMIDWDFPSFYPHSSIMLTRNFVKGKNADGSFALSSELPPEALLGYVARSTTHVMAVLLEMLGIFPDGAILFEAEKWGSQVNEIETKIRGLLQVG